MRTSLLFISVLFTLKSFASQLLPDAASDPGVRFFEDAQYEQAERVFKRHMAGDEKKQEIAHVYLAKLATLRNDGDTAVEHVNKSLAIQPNLANELMLAAEAHCVKAMQSSIFSALKFGKKCGQLYSKAAEEFPQNINAVKHAFLFHVEAPSMAGGSNSAAQEYLKVLNNLSEEDARIANIIMTTEDKGKEQAIELAHQYYSQAYANPANLYELAILFRDLEYYEKAIELFQRVLSLPSQDQNNWHKSDAVFQIGELSITQLNESNKGIKLIEQYLKTSNDIYDRHYFWARWRLARAYKDQGNTNGYQQMVAEIEQHDYSFNEAFVEQFEAAEH